MLTPDLQKQIQQFKEKPSEADAWWATDGRYYDPDTDDVDWYDKRKELALFAYESGRGAAANEAVPIMEEMMAEIAEMDEIVRNCGEHHTEKWLAEIPKITHSDQAWKNRTTQLEKRLKTAEALLRDWIENPSHRDKAVAYFADKPNQ